MPRLPRHLKISHASETPFTKGDLLYVKFGSVGLMAALDFDGTEARRNETGAFHTVVEVGSAARPTLHGDRLNIVNDNSTASFMIALDKRTGLGTGLSDHPGRVHGIHDHLATWALDGPVGIPGPESPRSPLAIRTDAPGQPTANRNRRRLRFAHRCRDVLGDFREARPVRREAG